MLTLRQGPGFGKTTALALATLGMAATLGKVYASAPTHVAVDNFAHRLDLVTARVTTRLNQGKQDDDRTHRKLVVRAHKQDEETAAFKHLLQHPHDGDNASRSIGRMGTTKWKLHLSLAYWLLMLIRSPGVRELSPDDSPALHEIQTRIDGIQGFEKLRAVATGSIPWEEYDSGTESKSAEDPIWAMMSSILEAADILCTTPALSNRVPYVHWKNRKAQGIAVDEAANITRPDLYCVWGNTLIPCLLAGDDKQLAPTVMTFDEKDSEGNFVNRLGEQGKISPLEWFKATGWSVYRLRTQLRMARGLFELSHSEVYSDLPFTYGDGCDVTLPAHSLGRELESFIQSKYPNVGSPAPGTLMPVFVHCEGSRCYVDDTTGSKKNPIQAKAALDFLCDFIKSAKLSPADLAKVVIITPYKANLELIAYLRKKPEYRALTPMPPAATADSFQGQEGDIAVIVMGTTEQKGPGFTTDERRLNVMLSRQKNGLIIFGDINVTTCIHGDNGKGKAKGKGKGRVKTKAGKEVKFQVEGPTGEKHWTRAMMLRNVYKKLYDARRFIYLDFSETGGEAQGSQEQV